jgi:hypothetical protein
MARKFVVSIDLNKNELQNARIQNLASAPSSPVAGQIYFNTVDHTLYFYNGTSWIPASGSTEVIQDLIGSSLIGGTGLTSSYDDTSGETTIDLDNTAVTSGSYGSTAAKTVAFTVDQQGRITAASEQDIQIATSQVTGLQEYIEDSVNTVVAAGEGIDVSYNDASNTYTISAEDASDTNKGIASFNSTDFTVTSGAVSLNKDPVITLSGDVTGSGTMTNLGSVEITTTVAENSVALGTDTTGNYIATIAGTTNEIQVSGSGSETAAVTIGLPDDVTITNNLTVGGNLNVTGTINSVNTTQVNIVDNKINLNTDFTGAPTADAGIRVERGTSSDVEILWNETDDRWTLTNNGSTYHAIARKYVASIGDGAATSYTVTHNLGTKDIQVQIYENASPFSQVETDVEHSGTDSVTIKFATAPSSNAYRVVVVG